MIKKAIAILLAGIGCGLIAYQLTPTISTTINRQPTPTPQWTEQPLILSDIEQATMSGDFSTELQENLILLNATPTPTLAFRMDIPASAAGDLVSPTVTIQGGPTEGSTIAQNSVCFPLWISDNMTPWQQLQTQAQLNTQAWSPWAPVTYYCFDTPTDGTYTFRVRIRDIAGNVSSEIQRIFVVKH